MSDPVIPDVIERARQGYNAEVIPRDAGTRQRVETRRAFYAGAHILFRSIMTILDPGEEPTDRDMAQMSAIAAELERFPLEVKAGRA